MQSAVALKRQAQAMPALQTNEAKVAATPAGNGWFRWVICGLLFLATTINYIDRQILGVLKSTLSEHFQWNEIAYSNLILAFQVAYAAGYALGGRFMDWVGVRLGYSVAVVLWSIAAMAHALAGSVPGFSAARFALRTERGRQFPGGDQDGDGMVPAPATRPGHRHLQLRQQCRRAARPGDGALDHGERSAGRRRFSSPAASGSSGLSCGWCCIATRRSIRGSVRPNWPSSTAIRPIRW